MSKTTIQRQIKHLLRDTSKDPYFEVTNIVTGKVTKYDEASLYLMVGADPQACEEVNRLARTGETSKDGKFKVRKIKPIQKKKQTTKPTAGSEGVE